jgi:hypothetical protein
MHARMRKHMHAPHAQAGATGTTTIGQTQEEAAGRQPLWRQQQSATTSTHAREAAAALRPQTWPPQNHTQQPQGKRCSMAAWSQDTHSKADLPCCVLTVSQQTRATETYTSDCKAALACQAAAVRTCQRVLHCQLVLAANHADGRALDDAALPHCHCIPVYIPLNAKALEEAEQHVAHVVHLPPS